MDMPGGMSTLHVVSIFECCSIVFIDTQYPSSAGMTDKRMDVDSHVLNMGEYGKNPASRHQIHKDSPMDRNPYMDKVSFSLDSSRIGVLTLECFITLACWVL